MDTAIIHWVRELQRQATLTPATVSLYVRDVRQFAAWLTQQSHDGSPTPITPGDIRDYRTALLDRRRAPATINRMLTSLTRFFDDQGRQLDNPARAIDRIRPVSSNDAKTRALEIVHNPRIAHGFSSRFSSFIAQCLHGCRGVPIGWVTHDRAVVDAREQRNVVDACLAH